MAESENAEMSLESKRDAWFKELMPIKPIPLEKIFPDLAKHSNRKRKPLSNLHSNVCPGSSKTNASSSQKKTISLKLKPEPHIRKNLFGQVIKQEKLTPRPSRRDIEIRVISDNEDSTDIEFTKLERKCTTEFYLQDSITSIEEILRQNQAAFDEYKRIHDENMLKISTILNNLKIQKVDCNENLMPSPKIKGSMDLRQFTLKKNMGNAYTMPTPRTKKAMEMSLITTQIVEQQCKMLQNTPMKIKK